MKLRELITLAIIIIVIMNSCKDDGTGPEKLEPGRRDYTWTVDTLNMPMNVIGTIWGSSPNDVWTTGAGGDDSDRLQHYDGNIWKAYTKEPISCEGTTLFGFATNDIWMGGSNNGMIWHYNGNNWSENYRYIVEGAYNVHITNIWGLKQNDIYACGVISFYNGTLEKWRGFILHYDGYTWKEVVRVNYNSQFYSIREEGNKVYVFALKTSTTVGDTVAFYELNGNELKEIYSASDDKIGFGNMHVVNGKVYFLIAQDIYRYINGNFVKQFSLTSQNFGYQFYGRNEKDIFVRMKDGLAHYNGTDLQYLYNFPLYMISIINEPALFEKEVFFCLWDATHVKNMVLHGKLNN